MSNNLGWTSLNGSDSDKSGKINAQTEILDAALTEIYEIVGDTSPTLTLQELREVLVIRTDGTQTTPQTVTLPATKKIVIVINTSLVHNLDVVTGTTTVTVSPTNTGFLRLDGTANGLEGLSIEKTSTFTDLTDTPASYSGQAGNLVVVNGTEDGLEFAPSALGNAVKEILGSSVFSNLMRIPKFENGVDLTGAFTRGNVITVSKPVRFTGASFNQDDGNATARVGVVLYELDITSQVLAVILTELWNTGDVLTGWVSDTEYFFPYTGPEITLDPDKRYFIGTYTKDGIANDLSCQEGGMSPLEGSETICVLSRGLSNATGTITEGVSTIEIERDDADHRWANMNVHYEDPTLIRRDFYQHIRNTESIILDGLLGNSELLHVSILPRSGYLHRDLVHTVVLAGTAPTADATIDIQLNGVKIGEITFLAGQTVGTITSAGCMYTAGSRLLFVNQATADATLADVVIALQE